MPDVSCNISKLNEKDLEAILKATDEIAKRTSYGLRNELAEEKGTILAWSNASKKWIVLSLIHI